nr:uncharacterized protein LOC109996495 [Labrus bergylta]
MNLSVDPQKNVSLREFSTITDTDNTYPVPSPSPVPANMGFSKYQTLFLIDLMQQHLETLVDGLPKTLNDFNKRLKSEKVNKRQLWKDTADKLGNHFKQLFCPKKVARKWNTLVDGYKKVKEDNRSPGTSAMRFQFYAEMDELMGGQHGVVFPVVGTSDGLEVREQEVVGHCSSLTAGASSRRVRKLKRENTPRPTATPTPPLKRGRVDDDVLQFLRDSEVASQQRHEETLAQLKSAQQGFEAIMTKFLEKL